jgi:threonine dehydratase
MTADDLTPPLTDREMDQARRRIQGAAIRTPLVREAETGAWLKLEALQPYGSYKIRGATNAIRARLERGPVDALVSASAGNFGQALAAAARDLGIPAVIHVPDSAARVKVAALTALGATVHEHSFERWWAIMQRRETSDGARFFHPVCEREVIAGAATIGVEIADDLTEVDTVLVPIGGGGLACGVAQGVRRAHPACRIIAVETETATPLLAAFQAGRPVTVERTPSFVDGMGSTRVLDEMWPLLESLVDEVVIVSLAEVEAAIRRLVRTSHVVAEGAGAAAAAAALKFPGTTVAAIVSGGNIDPAVLASILADGQGDLA